MTVDAHNGGAGSQCGTPIVVGWTLPTHEVKPFERNALAVVIIQLRFHPILKIADAEPLARFQDTVRPRFPGYEVIEGQSVEISPEGVRLRTEKAHRFPATTEPTVLSVNTSSLSIEYNAHKDRGVFLQDVRLALDALESVFAPVVPTRLGLRYVNVIRRDTIGTDLQRSVTWTDLLTPPFATPPGGAAELDDSTNFAVELSAPRPPGAMTLRYGVTPGSLASKDQHFRLDTDRFVDGSFTLKEVLPLLQRFSDDTFQVFMTAAGPALVDWMTRPRNQ
jgi:uncharacterized protein (TIGR04255 family)